MLHARTREDMRLELLRIWQAMREISVVVTHSIREAAFLSDRVLIMGRRPTPIIAEIRIDTPQPRREPAATLARRKELWLSCAGTAEPANGVATASSVKATDTITAPPFRSQSAVIDGASLAPAFVLEDHA